MSRTNKTKELLAQSLTELMVTTSLEKISLNDIVTILRINSTW